MLIGEVARRSGVSARTLRHYDDLGIVRPSRRSGGDYREYSDADLRRLFHVETLRSLGLTLAQAGDALDSPDFDPEDLLTAVIRRTENRMARDRELLVRLHAVGSAGPRRWEEVLDVVNLLQGLASADPSVRQLAALRLEGAAPPDAVTEAALREEVPNVAGALAWRLEHAGGADVEVLDTALRSGDAPRRRRATRILAGMAGVEGAATVLRQLLDDDDEVVRTDAALALGTSGAVDAVPALVRMILEGTRDVDAADALVHAAADPEQEQAILTRLEQEALAGGHDRAVRIRLLQALFGFGAPAATEALQALAADADPEVALVASALHGRHPMAP